MVTDGEFNSLRTQGETRPVHIWQIIHDARESVSRQKERTLVKILKKTGGVYVYQPVSIPSNANTFWLLLLVATR